MKVSQEMTYLCYCQLEMQLGHGLRSIVGKQRQEINGRVGVRSAVGYQLDLDAGVADHGLLLFRLRRHLWGQR